VALLAGESVTMADVRNVKFDNISSYMQNMSWLDNRPVRYITGSSFSGGELSWGRFSMFARVANMLMAARMIRPIES
jgi:hypothetical protein